MKPRTAIYRFACVALLLAACLLGPAGYSVPFTGQSQPAGNQAAAVAERTTVVVLATTDLHGNIFPVDEYTGRASNRGLAKIAALIARERAKYPNALLIDCGDTIQGSPLEYVHQRDVLRLGDAAPRDPMMLVMNYLHYDAMVVGNHEFNFGLAALHRARREADFPWLSANVAPAATPEEAAGIRNRQIESVADHMAERTFEPMAMEDVGGVHVAVIGLTTPAIPNWEPAEHVAGYRFEPMPEAARFWLKHARENREADIVILGVHAGLERDPKTGESIAGDQLPGENAVYQLAAGSHGVDAIVYGHTHGEVASEALNNVLLVQPKNFGQSLAEITFVLEREKPESHWRVVEKTSRLIPVTVDTPADSKVIELAKPYEEAAEKYLQAPVAQAAEPLEGRFGRVEDTAAMQAIHHAQLAAAKADISFAALFDPGVSIPNGPVTVRQLAALYLYDNTLYAIELTGAQVRQALEHSARYFNQYVPGQAGPLINPAVQGFNYDTAAGVSYKIDLSQQPGSRIADLRFKGQPIEPSRKFRVAVNSYRKAGGGGYTMFKDAPVLWRSTDDIRQLMIDYYASRKVINARAANNWEIVPEAARNALRAEVEKTQSAGHASHR